MSQPPLAVVFAVLAVVSSLLAIYDAFVQDKAPSPWLVVGAAQLILAKLYSQ